MKKLSTLRTIFAVLSIGLLFSGTALANSKAFLWDTFERFDPTATSNSGHMVVTECGGAFDGTDYYGQIPTTAKISTFQFGNVTKVRIAMRNGRPDTLYTVWLRLKGNDQDGNSFGGSPLTNGGSTPLAPGSALDELEAISPWNSSGATSLANGFMTDGFGNGALVTQLDFPLHGGTYPFNRISAASLINIRNLENPVALAIPTAIVDIDDLNVSGPFTLRIVSHCQDDLGHGLTPADRETWFDWPE